ncbi:MAG TPA: cellulase family glycosylhydrolase [Candidatus Angelobacter sp.]|nr:cellulase family glycosylhydrolase [Candidatus Angelobacter sp.]
MFFRSLSLRRKATLFLATTFMTSMSALAQGVGSWHTSGNQILDSNSERVRIAGVNWYGFETTDAVVHGLWAQDYHAILNAIKANGYNTIRLPYSNQMVETPIIPSNITFSNGSGPINSDIKGLTSLQVMDKIITAAGNDGLRVILVNHRSEAGNSAEANGLWYTSAYPESAWINDWLTLVNRYASFKDANGNPIVVGVDVRNEPHLVANGSSSGSCWTGDSATNGCPPSNGGQNWPAAAQRAGNAILNANPNLLIIVEGTDCYNGDCDWWGGNLEGVKSNPVVLNVPNRLIYSAHDYGPSLFQQSWFNGSTSNASLNAVWNKFWRYVSAGNTAPVLLGEFGTDNNSSDIQSSSPGSQGQWYQALVTYLQDDPALNWTSWALNGEDSYALLDNQYDPTPVSSLKQSMLASIQFPLGGGGNSCAVAPSAPTALSASAASSSQINLNWTGSTSPAGCSMSYSVFRGTTNGFTPSSNNQIASGIASMSLIDSGLAAATKYFYAVEANDAAGASGQSNVASATTMQSGVNQCMLVPAVPSGMNALAVSVTQINVTFQPVPSPANCAVTYEVFRSTVNGFTPSPSNQIASGVSAASFADAGLAPATTFFYRVEATDSVGASAPSEQVSATTPGVSGGFACHVDYSVVNQWNTGFQAAITIANTGAVDISSWILTWTFPNNQQITGLWNGSQGQSGNGVQVSNLSFNGAIPAHGSYSGVGFTANFGGTNLPPVNFAVNGTPCN